MVRKMTWRVLSWGVSAVLLAIMLAGCGGEAETTYKPIDNSQKSGDGHKPGDGHNH